jgi:hypothetical protein
LTEKTGFCRLLSALCSLPFAHLLIDFDGHVRADAPAEGASRAFTGIVAGNEVIALFVETFGKADDPLGAGFQAEQTSLAPFFINDNLSHFSPVQKIGGRS